jgi:hypothetical protein
MKQQKLPSLVVIIILTTITAIFWVAFSVYRVFSAKPSPDIPTDILAPLTPILDRATIEKIQGKLFFEENQIQTPVIVTPIATAEATPTLTPSPTATVSASPTESPSPSATPLEGT